MSQNAQILADLKRGRVITPLQALNSYGCFRLAARIKELRDQGHNIKTTIREIKGKRVGAYWI